MPAGGYGSGRPGHLADAREGLGRRPVAAHPAVLADLSHARLLHVNQPGVDLAHGLPAEAHAVHGAGEYPSTTMSAIRSNSVRISLPRSCLRLRLRARLPALISMKLPLRLRLVGLGVTIGPVARSRSARRPAGGTDPPRRHHVQLGDMLDLDHLGAQGGEEPPAAGAGQDPAEVDDPHAGEGEGLAPLAHRPGGGLLDHRLGALRRGRARRAPRPCARRAREPGARSARANPAPSTSPVPGGRSGPARGTRHRRRSPAAPSARRPGSPQGRRIGPQAKPASWPSSQRSLS